MRDRLTSHAVYAYMVVLSFWAVRKFAVDAQPLEPTLKRLAPWTALGPVFADIGSVSGPMALTALLTVVQTVDQMRAWGAATGTMIIRACHRSR